MKKKQTKRQKKHYEKPLKINATFDEVINWTVQEDEPPKFGEGGSLSGLFSESKKSARKPKK